MQAWEEKFYEWYVGYVRRKLTVLYSQSRNRRRDMCMRQSGWSEVREKIQELSGISNPVEQRSCWGRLKMHAPMRKELRQMELSIAKERKGKNNAPKSIS